MSTITNIVIKNSALNGKKFKESIDLALVCAAFEHRVNLIFVANGLSNLIPNQTASALGDKNQVDILKALEFYDIDKIFVEESTISKTLINADTILPNVNIIKSTALRELNLKADHLVVL